MHRSHLLVALIVGGIGFGAGRFSPRESARPATGGVVAVALHGGRPSPRLASPPAGLEAEPADNDDARRSPEESRRLFDEAIGTASVLNRAHRLQALMESLPAEDWGEVATWLDEVTPLSLRRAFTDEVVRRWAEVDPGAALAWLDGSSAPDRGRELGLEVLRELAHQDPDAAERWARALTRGGDRERALAIVVDGMVDLEPERAFAILAELPRNAARAYADRLFRAWAEEDLPTALARANGLTDGRAREAALRGVIDTWSAADPGAAGDWLAAQPADRTTRLLSTALVAQLTQTEPEQAVALAARLLPAEDARGSIAVAAGMWAADNPEAALSWAQGLTDPETRSAALIEVLPVYALEAPEAAAAAALRFPEGDDRLRLVSRVAERWVDTDSTGALRWALGLPDAERDEALSGMSSRWAELDPEGAAAAVRDLPAGEGRYQVALSAASEWAAQDPEAAARWASTLGDDELVSTALGTVCQRWLDRDPDGARTYVESLSNPELRAEVGGRLARQWANDEPQLAATWALAVLSGEERERVSIDIVRQWTSEDPETAGTWVHALSTGPVRDFGLTVLANRADEPGAALAELMQIEDAEHRAFRIRDVYSSWVAGDPEAAEAWHRAHPTVDVGGDAEAPPEEPTINDDDGQLGCTCLGSAR